MSTPAVTSLSSPLIESGRNNTIRAARALDLQYSVIGRIIIYRLVRDRDVKIVVTSKGTQTGTGKTMLAIRFAREIQRWINLIFQTNVEWSGETHGFMNPWEYFDVYDNAQTPQVFAADELELFADKRKFMTHQNIKLSHAWQLLRYKNCVTIATAPSLHDLDLRVKEHTDLWINVIAQGLANTYYMTQDDFTGKPIYRRLRMRGLKETMSWLPLQENDPDFAALHNEKKGMSIFDDYQDLDDDDDIESPQEIDRRVRYDIMAELADLAKQDIISLDQSAIGRICGPGDDGYSQQTVSKAYKDWKTAQEANA